MTLDVRMSVTAEEDLVRLFDFLLNTAETVEDLDPAQVAILTMRLAVLNQLSATPHSFRKAGISPTRRELIIPFGASGYVALYKIASPSSIVVLAVWPQREEDDH
jgi:plasmid stabilization system protein ParE